MDDMNQFIANLQSPSQRLIELHFGAETPLKVQQQILEDLSPCFIKAHKGTFGRDLREILDGACRFLQEGGWHRLLPSVHGKMGSPGELLPP
ncbi:hypothetical protein TI39_contig348g00013 [Zymoseptoria brevis]|uniref:Uncharacterized protein n=1 Tax=Zymoseptoria brevis TaxID=1047168 RepID=A0A0F4GUL2_9PEZI|nr:hypothetical protein TI39_contig348g00013 [Zymoseptoria brevis]